MNLSDKKLLILDRGPYSYIAEFLARYFGKVYYHCLTAGPYTYSPLSMIGNGLPDVEQVDRPWKTLKKVDMVFFPDVHDGDLAGTLLDFGIPVCSSLNGELMELDKYHFKTVCKEAGLPVAHTYRAEGLDELWDYVKDKPGPLFMKNSEQDRGDWETKKHMNRYDTKLFLNKKRHDLGEERAKDIEILVERPIESKVEIGIDGFRLNGQLPKNIALGYEIKDEGLIEKIFPVLPPICQNVIDVLSEEYEKLGYQGPYHSEMRITDEGVAYPIDDSCRCGRPSTPVLSEMLGKDYAQAIWSLAHGELPVIEPEFNVGAEIILSSMWHIKEELHVGYPKELGQWLKLSNCRQSHGERYCVPNGDDGIFGSIVAVGKTIKEVTEIAVERVKEIECFQLDWKENLFDEVEEIIAEGRKVGLNF